MKKHIRCTNKYKQIVILKTTLYGKCCNDVNDEHCENLKRHSKTTLKETAGAKMTL